MGKKSNFSLTVIVMVFAIITIFVGYFIGNWMIRMAVGSPEQETKLAKQEENEEENTETVEIDKKEENIANSNDQNNEINTGSFSSGGYAVQIGAFNNYDNALSLKKDLENEGYEVVITEGKPHKVRLGPSQEKEEAEKIKEEIESLGYSGFVINLNN
ncbi:MAG: SPOR domain-containing protein [Bacillota bacterium]